MRTDPDLVVVEEAAPESESATGVPPQAKAERRGHLLTVAGALVSVTAVFLMMFVGFELWFSGLYPLRAQRALLTDYQSLAIGGPATVSGWTPAVGDGIALMSIPKLGLQDVVIEGTTPDMLKQGPGHLSATPLPGELGNVVIAGRRTTYGAPFRNLSTLAVGDLITFTTAQGEFTYVVKQGGEVAPGQPDVYGSTDTPRLTLVTVNAPYVPTARYAVVATLEGLPLPPVARAPVVTEADETGSSGNRAAVGPVLLWGELLVVGLVLMWWLIFRRRFSSRVTWMLGTPIVLALIVLLFENVSRLLPATL